MDTAKNLWETFTGSGGKGPSKKAQDEKERADKMRKDRDERIKKDNARRLLHSKLKREAEERKHTEERQAE